MNAKRVKTIPAGWVMLVGLVGALLGWGQTAEATQRIALVIGNGNYADKPLTHPKRDAADMAALLRGLGFEVTEATDLKLGDLRQRVRAFIDAGRGAELRLFYYSGHGANYQNQSYLLPVGHDIQRVYELPEQGFPVQALLRGLREEDPKGINVVLLDACRDEPFGESKSIGSEHKGLGRVAASAGSLVAYATGAGQKAMGLHSERNSQFTKHLLRYLKEPVEIKEALTRVRRAVYQEAPDGQLPETSDSLIDPLYLVGAPAAPVASAAPGTVVVPSPFRPQPPALTTGQVFQDPLSDGTPGPKMVVIPAGEFWMGSAETEKGREKNERRHRVRIERSFAIGQTEVTFEEYDRFSTATGHDRPDDGGWGRGKRPVMEVSWHDAVAYADWLSAQTGQTYRLPTEAEWEYAARAGTDTAYWWGENMIPNKANCIDCASRWNSKFQTAPVGSFPANPWGLYDTAGNVWEWTCSKYDEDYDNDLETRCATKGDINSAIRVIRGGSWGEETTILRSASRSLSAPADRYRYQARGFRLAKSL